MTLQATMYKEGDLIDHTPSGALTAGNPVEVSPGVVGIPPSDIAAGIQGALAIRGVFKGVHATGAGNVGDNIFWDANGDPLGGTAGTGAFTTIQTNGDFWVGTLERAAAASATAIYIHLNRANPELPVWPNRVHELKADNYTIDALDDGKVIHIATDAKAFTLLATVVGLDIIFVNDGADAAVAVNLSPNANDKIMGPDIAGTDNKDQINTKTTAVHGDWMHLVGDGSAGWNIIDSRGTWAEEA